MAATVNHMHLEDPLERERGETGHRGVGRTGPDTATPDRQSAGGSALAAAVVGGRSGAQRTAGLMALQRFAGNRATAALLSVQRENPGRPLGPDDPVPESVDQGAAAPGQAGDQSVPAGAGDQGGSGDGAAQPGDEPAGVQRQRGPDEIPPPPPAFPRITEWNWLGTEDGSLSYDLSSRWSMTCSDLRERGFHVQWNSNTGKTFRADDVIGEPYKKGDKRAYIYHTIPPDRPPIYTVGWCHTHPPPLPGETHAVGQSDIDEKDAASSKMPGGVYDYATREFKRNDGKLYFYGPAARS